MISILPLPSIGAKLDEYVTTYKAIVTEPLFYEAPYFTERIYYLPFRNIEQCIEIGDDMMSDESRRRNIRKNNHQYYMKYLRLDRLGKGTLQILEQ